MSNNERMYAIVFDLDTDKLKALYHNTSWNKCSIMRFGSSKISKTIGLV